MTRPKKLRPGRGQRNLDGTIHCLRCGRLLVQATAGFRERGSKQGTRTSTRALAAATGSSPGYAASARVGSGYMRIEIGHRDKGPMTNDE